ncbi:phosphonate C-P lyase system protein PhnG [Pelovirga terrestris]|uniref:Phosphonate C-P lyase system protein PhnG n=1 Tax=Pelovirga terrestris TaxID=2771352 RepID=A0A8J6QYV3_9BACT|nr:phosphonate C-P lyase system protein PhnG [Pelovirga terrestris]MBD1400872.1 phosphonate C-P lyase system protein PhnG [Pelovirga terrestris]
MNEPSPSTLRRDWPRLLLTLPAHHFSAALREIKEQCQVVDLALPQAGLALLQLRDGALAEPYFIGEIPLARAVVRVTDPEGRQSEGAAQIMDDRAGLARDIAICDAVLAAGLAGEELIHALLTQGTRLRAQIDAERGALLTRTRVDFSLLDGVSEGNDL